MWAASSFRGANGDLSLGLAIIPLPQVSPSLPRAGAFILTYMEKGSAPGTQPLPGWPADSGGAGPGQAAWPSSGDEHRKRFHWL